MYWQGQGGAQAMPLRQERGLLPATVLGASVRSASRPAGRVCVCVCVCVCVRAHTHACVYVSLKIGRAHV